jgi:hypothetical protein
MNKYGKRRRKMKKEAKGRKEKTKKNENTFFLVFFIKNLLFFEIC